MNVHATPIAAKKTNARHPLIDCDVHPSMPSDAVALRYLAKEWHEFHAIYRNYARSPAAAMDLFPGIEPNIARRDTYTKDGGLPGSDLDLMREQLLDMFNVECGILQPLAPNGGNQRQVEYGAALASAVNEWQLAEWVDPEPRLRASLTVASDNLEASVAEIRRHGKDRRFAQVGLNCRTSEPGGRKRYWPIYAEAQDHGLPLGIHSGGNSGAPVFGGAGWASFHIQQHQANHQNMAALLVSLVLEGVLAQFPRLKILLVEGAFTWLPAMTWRLDRIWERNRTELFHLSKPPSEYIREQVWISSQPIDVFKKPEDLQQFIDWIGWDKLCFATDYPHWDFDDPDYAFPFKMTAEQQSGIFLENAKSVLRLS